MDGERNGLRAGIEYRLPPSYSLLLQGYVDDEDGGRDGVSEGGEAIPSWETLSVLAFGEERRGVRWKGERRGEEGGGKEQKKFQAASAGATRAGRRKARDPELR